MASRYWTHPDRRRDSQFVFPRRILVVLWGLVGVVTALVVVVTILTIARSQAVVDQQQQINSTFCQVMAQLPADDVELAHIRGELGCKQRGLTPAQMKELAKTGGTK